MNARTIRAHEPQSTLHRRSRTEPSGPRRSGTAHGLHNARRRKRARPEAREAGQAAASDAARAAVGAAGAAFLHPLAKATQVKHILGSAAHAARAFELEAGDDPAVGADHIARARALASPVVLEVLKRYPGAPAGGGRVGELIRQLDALLR